MKQSEFVRWLVQRGATYKEGKNHRHPSKELKSALVEAVKKTA